MSDSEKQPTTPIDEVTTAPISLNSDDTDPSDGRAPQSPRAHLFVTVSHWSMVLLIVLAILSGMRLGWGYNESPLGGQTGIWATIVGSIAPTGSMFGINLIDLHVTLAFGVLATVVLYFIYLLRSRTLIRLRFTSHDMQKMREGINNGSFWRNKRALWSANLLVNAGN